MTLTEAEQSIFTAFRDGWLTTTQVSYPNVKFSTELVDEFVRISIIYATSEEPFLRGCGVLGKQYFGNIFIQIFAEANNGNARWQELYEKTNDILQQKNININVSTGVSTLNKIGIDGKFYNVNNVIPFTFENIIST